MLWIIRRWAACLPVLMPAYGASNDLPIIDAHSQFDENAPAERVIEYAARAGVTQILLSPRGQATSAQVLEMGSTYPACIVPSVRTKGAVFVENRPDYYMRLD